MPSASIKPSALLADHGSDVGAVVLASSPSLNNIQGNPTSETSMQGGMYQISAYHSYLKTARRTRFYIRRAALSVYWPFASHECYDE